MRLAVFQLHRWYPPDNRLDVGQARLVELFAPYGWAMGTGDYLDLRHAARLHEGIERLRAGSSATPAASRCLGLDGQILCSPLPGDEGTNYRQLARPEEQWDIQRRMLALASEGEAHGVRLAPAGQRHQIDTRSALVQRFAPWNIVLVATLSSREIQATIDAESQRLGLPVVASALRGLVAVLAILGGVLASALFSRWMIGLQGYKRDLDAHALALEQKAGELHLAGHVFESSKEGIPITDAGAASWRSTQPSRRSSGYRAEEVVGKQPDLLASGKHEPTSTAACGGRSRETGSWAARSGTSGATGSVFPELLQITTVRLPAAGAPLWAPSSTSPSAKAETASVSWPSSTPHRAAQPQPAARPDGPGDGPRRTREPPCGGPGPRPRPLQDHQRLPRPRHRRPAAAGAWPPASAQLVRHSDTW